jgi:hypothetical protein
VPDGGAWDVAATERLLDKLRYFIAEDLDDEERAAFAVLLAHGVAALYGDRASDVQGYDMEATAEAGFLDELVRALRTAGVRVTGLGL